MQRAYLAQIGVVCAGGDCTGRGLANRFRNHLGVLAREAVDDPRLVPVARGDEVHDGFDDVFGLGRLGDHGVREVGT